MDRLLVSSPRYCTSSRQHALIGCYTAFEVALEIHEQAPWVFERTEVFADGGVRYGSDIVKLLALGVKAVGLGRAFMYSNVYGEAGVHRAINILKKEIAMDAGNLGIADLKQINSSYVGFDLWARQRKDILLTTHVSQLDLKHFNRAWGL